jgi:VWFA-related protein
VLVVISDGGDNESSRTLADITRLAEQSSAVIFTVGIFSKDDPDANPRVLKRLAEATGGDAFFPKELSEISSICDHIAHDIRNQYTIGYVSNNVKPDGTRRIVRLTAGKLRVRTRTGYIAHNSRAK